MWHIELVYYMNKTLVPLFYVYLLLNCGTIIGKNCKILHEKLVWSYNRSHNLLPISSMQEYTMSSCLNKMTAQYTSQPYLVLFYTWTEITYLTYVLTNLILHLTKSKGVKLYGT